jgi:hypothetical protein
MFISKILNYDTELLRVKGTKDYIPTLMLSREEALVHTAAHEARHIWQHMTRSLLDKLPPEETHGKPHPGVGSDRDAYKFQLY